MKMKVFKATALVAVLVLSLIGSAGSVAELAARGHTHGVTWETDTVALGPHTQGVTWESGGTWE